MLHHLLGIERYEYEKCDNVPQGMKHRAPKIAFVHLARMQASSIVFWELLDQDTPAKG